MDFNNLKEIVSDTLVGKQLRYINSKGYDNTTIIDVVDIIYQDSTAEITIQIETNTNKNSKNKKNDKTQRKPRKRLVKFLNDDIITVVDGNQTF